MPEERTEVRLRVPSGNGARITGAEILLDKIEVIINSPDVLESFRDSTRHPGALESLERIYSLQEGLTLPEKLLDAILSYLDIFIQSRIAPDPHLFHEFMCEFLIPVASYVEGLGIISAKRMDN